MTIAQEAPPHRGRNSRARVRLPLVRQRRRRQRDLLQLGPGITALLGPNGAGKSTVLHMMSGFLRASRGTVRVLGQPAFGNPEIYRQVGLVPEREAVYAFMTGLRLRADDGATASAWRTPKPPPGAPSRSSDMEAFQKRKMGGYSKGMKQRIKVAAGIVHEPSVLLLDEPFNGMDPAQTAPDDGPPPADGGAGQDHRRLLAHPRRGRAAGRITSS